MISKIVITIRNAPLYLSVAHRLIPLNSDNESALKICREAVYYRRTAIQTIHRIGHVDYLTIVKSTWPIWFISPLCASDAKPQFSTFALQRRRATFAGNNKDWVQLPALCVGMKPSWFGALSSPLWPITLEDNELKPKTSITTYIKWKPYVWVPSDLQPCN